MTGCSMAAKRMGNDLITGKKKINDVSNAMNTASTSTKAFGIAMNVFMNVGFMLAITAITKVISELAQAQENAIQTAKEATETYNEEVDSIDEYKKKLSELHKELNSGNLSYEETKTKRTELMSIQDELIEKFGTEKGAIESVTEAIKGQVDALDGLNEKAYRDWVAKADEETIWTKLLPGGKSGLDQAIDYMETEQTVSFYDMQNANLSKELQAIQTEIDETIKAKYNLDKTFAMFNVTGTPEEIKSQLESIRQDYLDLSKEAFLKNGISSELWEDYRKEAIDSINEVINKFDDGLEKHKETYQTYIEGMIKYDSEYSDEYANILQKRAELETAENSGNEDDIKNARQAFMDAISDGIEESSSNENIKKYFESLYPELQSEFASWNFEFAIDANTDSLGNIANEIGEKYKATDLLGMLDDDSAIIADSAFNSLIDKAIEYGICTDKSADEVKKLIDLLVELGYVQGEVQGSTLDNETTILTYEELEEKIKTISSSAKSARTSISQLNDAFAEQKEYGKISVDTMLDLVESGYATALQFDSVTGACTINTQAMQELIKAKIENQIQDLQTLKTNIAARLHKDGVIASESAIGFISLASAKLANVEATKAQQEEDIEAFNNAEAQIIALKNAFNNYDNISNGDYTTSFKAVTDTAKKYIESYMDFQKISLEKSLIDYNTYSSTISNLLKKMWKDGKISAKEYYEYYDYTGKLLDNQKSIYDKVLSAVQRRFDKEINAIEESISAIEKQNDALEKQKDNYDKVISTVVKYLESLQDELDKDIELIEDENNVLQDQIDMYDGLLNAVSTVFDEQREAAQSEIDLLQERIDKLQEANDEENRAIELQKARAELERARNQRTKLVYTHENGFVYQSDDTAIREAESNLADLEFESTINALEKEKELLQDIIDQLDEAEEKWSDIADAFDKKKNLSIAEQIFGENYKEIILASDPQVIEDIMNKYVSAQEKMEDNETTIESIEAKKKKYDELITKWEQVAKKQEETTNREITSLILGKDWQKLVLEDRTADYDNFCEEYLSIQEKILDNEAEIASLEEKKTIYENLKQEWSDISSAYEDSIEDQYAAMILGKNWESSIFDERRIVLNNFKNDYEMIQRQIADAAWNSANEQVKAAQTALEALNKLREESKYSTAGSVNTIITKPSSPNKDMIQFYHDGIKSGIVGKGQSSKQKHEVLKRASTGLLTDEIPAILQKGEVVLTRVQQNNLAENLMRKPIILNHENMFKNNLPDYSKLSDTVVKPINSYSIGEVNVTCPGITSDDVAKQIGSAIKREFNGLSLMATQKMSITR